MASAIMVDRSTFSSAPAGSPAAGPSPAAPAANWCVVPRCDIRVEKCKDGCKIHCSCDDEVARGTLQNLCRMLAGGLCSICCQLNGATICECKFSCCLCKCELTEDGCCITCCSGDKACCEMTQACCEAIACCLKNGCSCYVCFNGTPVCCCC